jgi:hypothetical protein
MIPRKNFYAAMSSSVNLAYIEEISGFKKSKADVNLFEVMSRMDVFDIIKVAWEHGDKDLAQFVNDAYLTPSKGGFVSWEGFDCYRPKEERRDYVIKQYIKTRTRPAFMSELKLEEDRTESLMDQIFPTKDEGSDE